MRSVDIYKNLERVSTEIPKNVELIAVSKTKTLEDMKEAYDFGIRNFGENKVQEFLKKYEDFYRDVKWHLIGHLQKNKAKYIVGKVDLIHSLDSVGLLNEIEKVYSKDQTIANVLIQINIGREEQKYGILEEDLDILIGNIEKCSNVKVKGIMVIVPRGTKEESRIYFKKTYEIWKRLKNQNFNNITMDVLSMGMSGDYDIAIEEGSTMVRIGRGIFGERDYKNN